MLSPGQLEIRKIVKHHLDEYNILKPADKQVEKEEDAEFYGKIINSFDTNTIIREDPITAGLLSNNHVSTNYLEWCRKFSKECNTDVSLSFNGLVYGRRDRYENSISKPRYTGGLRPYSTISSLFGLANGTGLHEQQFFTRHFYFPSGLLEVKNGGNHRLLACVLWGDENEIKKNFKVHTETRPDEELSKALLEIDELFPSPDRGSRFSFRNLYMPDGPEKEDALNLEVDDIKHFYRASHEEKLMVQKILIDDSNKKVCSFSLLKDTLNNLRSSKTKVFSKQTLFEKWWGKLIPGNNK